jgi:hypothetical protein
MAEGVAHAPLVLDSDADIDRGDDTGGTERRPLMPREVQHRERVRNRLALSPHHASMQGRTRANYMRIGGTVLPRLCSPRFVFAFVDPMASRGGRVVVPEHVLLTLGDGVRAKTELVQSNREPEGCRHP